MPGSSSQGRARGGLRGVFAELLYRDCCIDSWRAARLGELFAVIQEYFHKITACTSWVLFLHGTARH